MTGPTILNGMGVPMSDAEALCVLYLFDKLGRKRKRDTHTEARRMVLEHFDGDVAKAKEWLGWYIEHGAGEARVRFGSKN